MVALSPTDKTNSFFGTFLFLELPFLISQTPNDN